MKHGSTTIDFVQGDGFGSILDPIALIVDGMPAVFIATNGLQYDKITGDISEVRARKGKTIIEARCNYDSIFSAKRLRNSRAITI